MAFSQELMNALDVVLASIPASKELKDTLNGVGEVRVATKYVTSAQILALFTTPVEIVPAPGAGYYLEFLGAQLFIDYNSAAYASDAGEDLVFKYTNAAGAEISNTIDGTVGHATADTLAFAQPTNAAAQTIVAAANAAIVLHCLVGNWITGNSPIKVRCYYRRVKTSDLEAISA